MNLESAAAELRARHDGLFQRHLQLALGYIEKAARSGISRNARRLIEDIRRGLTEHEETAQMKFTPDEMEQLRAEANEPSPPSLVPGAQRKR